MPDGKGTDFRGLPVGVLSGIFRNVPEGMVVLDEHGRIVEHNARFFALMRFCDADGVALGEDAALGRSFVELVGDAFPGLAAYLRAPSGDLEVRAPLGERHLEIRATSLMLPSGQYTGAFVLVRDVSEQLAVEAREAIIRKDLEHARAFQRAMLPKPPTVPGYDLAVTYRPVSEVGGDIYDVALIGADRLRIFIADATGHGVSAALATMLIKGAYDSVKQTSRGPAAVLAALNDHIVSTVASLDAMFTATIIDVHLAANTLRFACGGHPPSLVARPHGAIEELEWGGPIVGVAPGMIFPSWERRLEFGDALYLVTDGIAESRRGDGEFFGDARLHQAVVEANELASSVGEAILARVETWLSPSKLDDDVTIIALRPAHFRHEFRPAG
jgi:sigma-B regulation protein RsbU (phosphoserine phosphatase)